VLGPASETLQDSGPSPGPTLHASRLPRALDLLAPESDASSASARTTTAMGPVGRFVRAATPQQQKTQSGPTLSPSLGQIVESNVTYITLPRSLLPYAAVSSDLE
jgi:hypothetical protein